MCRYFYKTFQTLKVTKMKNSKSIPASLIAGLFILQGAVVNAQTADTAIRPFHFKVPEKTLVDLKHRIQATQWPDREVVKDETQGVQLATMKALAKYWATQYDWRKIETKLNSVPQFVTKIDGVDIHFIHVRSKHKNALPVIITHGWPGSIIELLAFFNRTWATLLLCLGPIDRPTFLLYSHFFLFPVAPAGVKPSPAGFAARWGD